VFGPVVVGSEDSSAPELDDEDEGEREIETGTKANFRGYFTITNPGIRVQPRRIPRNGNALILNTPPKSTRILFEVPAQTLTLTATRLRDPYRLTKTLRLPWALALITARRVDLPEALQ
jgi:hypothetical protein